MTSTATRRPGKLTRRQSERLKKAFTLYLPLTLFIVVILFPFYWMLITSLKPNAELYNTRLMPFWVLQPTLDNYAFLFENTLFLRWVANSLLVTVVSTAVSLFCGIIAGYALSRLHFRGSNLIGLAIFVTYLVPQTLLFLPLANVISTLGLNGSLGALMVTYPSLLIPFCTWMLAGYFRGIPRELEESAMVDGASRIRSMVSIVLPLALPGILSAGIFAFTLSWNEYIYALIFTSAPDIKTIPVGVTMELIRGDLYFWGPLMAGALLGSVPVALIYSLFVDHYVAGLTAGAVKG
jgi:multiple sugar transport system permease protein